MRTAGWIALMLLAPALVGCIGTADDEITPASTPETGASPLEDPMAALDAGNESANLDVLGVWGRGGTQEIDPWEDTLFVDRGSEIHILDVSDPREPTELASFTGPFSPVDLKVSDDGRYLFIGDDQELSGDPQGGTGPLTGGVYVYDVSDRTDPVQVTYEPVGNSRGPHMVFYHNATDGEYVYTAAGQDVVIHQFVRSEGVLQEIARYTPGQLEQDRHPNRLGALYNPQGWLHDMFVETQPDGTTLMFVAAWDAGLHIVDVSDPATPEKLGTWSDFADDEAGNLHTVSTDWIGERRITVGAVEVGFGVVGGTLYATGDEKSVTYVWDTTEPSEPELVGTWTNPIDPTSDRDLVPEENVTSTHNLQLENGRLYLAHYDYGVWVLDLSTPENQSEPKVLAYHDDGEMHTWDVVLEDGVMYTSGRVGIKGLAFPLEEIGPNGTTSRA